MLRLVVAELVHRRARTLALMAGIVVATTSFAVLTASSSTQRLEVRGTVAQSFRGTYDILVRPRGSRSTSERAGGAVQPNFLSGLTGGITTRQVRRIGRLPGIEVAAPIANVGYLLPTAKVSVDLSPAARGPGRVLLRARVTWRSDSGLTRTPDAAQYIYVTPNPLRPEPAGDDSLGLYRRFSLREDVAGRAAPVPVCNRLSADRGDAVIFGPYTRLYRSGFGCFSRASGNGRWGFEQLRRSPPRLELRWPFPLLLTAIDPRAEARLTGLDRAVVEGRYLRPSDTTRVAAASYRGRPARQRFLPVMIAARTYLDEQADVAVERLPAAAAARWARPFPMDGNDVLAPVRWLIRRPGGPVVQRLRVPVATGYRQLLRQLHGIDFEVQEVKTVWRVGPIAYRRVGDTLVPETRAVDPSAWQSNPTDAGLFWAYAPAAGRDTRFRAITTTQARRSGSLTRLEDDVPLLRSVGVFDPDRGSGNGQVGGASLTVLQPPLLTARDAATRGRLGGQPLRPNGNLGGYLAQPPALLTTLQAARAFARPLFPDFDPERGISAVRVRVAGVTGIDALSRERIRQAAERIAAATGLDVDITAGASGAPTPVDLPAGRFGRPELALTEPWIRKGVATQVLSAIDRKSLILFALILVVCALFVANAASAAVRSRRIELGILAALGWSRTALFAVITIELGAVGLAAGLLGGALSLPLAALADVSLSPIRPAIAVGAATVLALLAAAVPAGRAARADPVSAISPLVLDARRARSPRTVGGLALVNLTRTPGRTALAALSLAIGICALTLLLAATVAFQNTLVGSLLGDAVALQVRKPDLVAVLATIALGGAAVADVLFLNLRDRAAEFATLRAIGWDEATLSRLVALEGLGIGAIGGIVGALAGLVGAAVFAGTLPGDLIAVSAAAALAGALLAALAAIAPAAWLRRAALVPLLAGGE